MSEQKRITRRRFLALAGGAAGVTALACCGLTALGTRQPAVEFAETSCGRDDDVSGRILVAYASRCGTTGGVAQAIGEMLCENGTAVDVRLAKDVADVSGYRAVVVGSAIRMGRWLAEATEFVDTHRDALGQVPVAYFATCMTLAEDTEENREEASVYLDPIREKVQPVDVGLFAGAMDPGTLPIVHRLLVKAMKVPEGDFRDWNVIRAWAAGLHPALVGA